MRLNGDLIVEPYSQRPRRKGSDPDAESAAVSDFSEPAWVQRASSLEQPALAAQESHLLFEIGSNLRSSIKQAQTGLLSPPKAHHCKPMQVGILTGAASSLTPTFSITKVSWDISLK